MCNYEDMGCDGCRYINTTEYEQPCISCKNNYMYYDKEYDLFPLQYEPAISYSSSHSVATVLYRNNIGDNYEYK